MTRRSSAEALQRFRVDLACRLRARAPEIENAIVAKIRSLSDPIDEDPTYVAGLHEAVAVGLAYGLEGIERGAESEVPVPTETARQARRAARKGVKVETILRRYTAGNKTLEEFIAAEAEDAPRKLLQQILSEQGPQVDRLMESVSAEYRDELVLTRSSSVTRRASRVIRLLKSNSLVSPTDLDYDFELWHVGIVLMGTSSEAMVPMLAECAGCRSLSIAYDSETTWAWLGSSHQAVESDLARFLTEEMSAEISAAVGESRRGLDGWRQTHREAQIALQVMLYKPSRVIRCRDVILDAAVTRDQWLTRSLIETYLAPLEGRSDSGARLRKTLRAYYETDRNIASAAAALGVTRHTVERHLRRVEERLGRNLDTCSAQLQVALRAEELAPPPPAEQRFSV